MKKSNIADDSQAPVDARLRNLDLSPLLRLFKLSSSPWSYLFSFYLSPFFFLSSRFFFISDGIRTEEGVVSLSSRPSLCIVTECSAHRVGFYFINLNVGDVHVKYFARLAKFEANQMPRCLVFSFFNSSLSLFFLFFFFFFFRLSFGRHED